MLRIWSKIKKTSNSTKNNWFYLKNLIFGTDGNQQLYYNLTQALNSLSANLWMTASNVHSMQQITIVAWFLYGGNAGIYSVKKNF